ncbi:tRNA1(Val) (adenine(37)-N6)-methyltransferase [Bacteroidia bacterium]|nr:tRNA1(Val) (adenine(37)-N6)-methyltransferase [Bacteroidia bacterium]GHV45052.1 tRNA1(Val) (adenine(37)-N6)-methyltransferase [Bacteroidia bacterium]
MKVGVDGVLLGAWADVADAQNVLDIGTGSGLIALMVAQRNSTASIEAIDIDEDAVAQAQINFRNSVYSARISEKNSDFRKFMPENKKFDHIVCNPPFFVNSLQSPENQRTTARHSISLTHEELLEGAKKLVTEKGKISLILPVAEGNKATDIATKFGLTLHRKTIVFPKPAKAAKRFLLEFVSSQNAENKIIIENSLTIETEQRGIYTKEYTELVKDFYLKM